MVNMLYALTCGEQHPIERQLLIPYICCCFRDFPGPSLHFGEAVTEAERLFRQVRFSIALSILYLSFFVLCALLLSRSLTNVNTNCILLYMHGFMCMCNCLLKICELIMLEPKHDVCSCARKRIFYQLHPTRRTLSGVMMTKMSRGRGWRKRQVCRRSNPCQPLLTRSTCRFRPTTRSTELWYRDIPKGRKTAAK